MSYTIIYISTKSSSNEIEGYVVVFIPLQLTLGRVVERHRDYVRLLHDLPNSMILARKIVSSSIFPVTKILVIEDHQLYCAFLHVTFRSQSMLNPTGDQTDSNTN
jgi:hypothetical protein